MIRSHAAPAAWGDWPPAPAIIRAEIDRALASLLDRLKSLPTTDTAVIVVVEPKTADELAHDVPVNAETALIGSIRIAGSERAWDVEWNPITRVGRLKARHTPTRELDDLAIAHALELAAEALETRVPAGTRIERRPSSIAQAHAAADRSGGYRIGELVIDERGEVWSVSWNPALGRGGMSSSKRTPIGNIDYLQLGDLEAREGQKR